MMRVMVLIFVASALVLSACNGQTTDSTREPTSIPALAWRDVSELVYGICYEAAFDAAGQTFALRDEDALSALFDLADSSGLCRRPVTRAEYDFQPGEVIIGLWRVGEGCTANYTVDPLERDPQTGTIIVPIHFSTDGDCPYELLRPLWLAVSGVGEDSIAFRQGE